MSIEEVRAYEPLFGAWRVVEQIGEGAFGEVYLVEREDFGVRYQSALKFIRIPASKGEVQSVMDYGMSQEGVTAYFRGIVEDMVKEIGIMSRMKGHSNVVSYEDHVCHPHPDGMGWDLLIRMELLKPLQRHVKAHPLTEADVVRLGIDLCRALELCERNGIIHRDVKPANIMVSDNGDFKLGDFGIARTIEKSVGAMSRKGTYSYMAPEVYRGMEYGNTADLYSLGIVMYQLLNNNRTPFMPAYPQVIRPDDEENARVLRLKGEPIPAPGNGAPALQQIILRACAYAPEARFSSAAEMRRALEDLRDGVPPEAADGGVHVTQLPPDESTPRLTGEAPPVLPGEAVEAGKKTELLDENTELLGEKTALLDEKTELLGDRGDALGQDSGEIRPPEPSLPTPAPASARKKGRLPMIVGIAAIAVVSILAIALTAGRSKPTPTPGPGTSTYVPSTARPSAVSAFQLGGTEFQASDTRIELRDAGLTDADLAALPAGIACTNLILTGNQLTDLTPIGAQTQLRSLYLGNNQIGDIHALSGLSALEALSLVHNSISDLSPLSALAAPVAATETDVPDAPPLSYLELSHNQITDVSALAGLTNLTYLALDNNQIQDVTPLMGLTGLETLLLGGNPIPREQIVALRQALPDCQVGVYYELAEHLEIVEPARNPTAGRAQQLEIATEPAGVGGKVNAGELEAVWSVSDESIAQIDAQGQLTGKKAGTVTVTVELDGLTAQREITVGNAVAGLSISPGRKQLTAGSAFTISINADYSWASFSSSNSSVATVDASGTVVAKTAGSAVITVTTDVGSASCSVYVVW